MTSPDGASPEGRAAQNPPPPRPSLSSKLFLLSALVVLSGLTAAWFLADRLLRAHSPEGSGGPLLAWLLLIAGAALCLLWLAGAWAKRGAKRDLQALEDAALRLGEGDFARETDPVRIEELGDLARLLDGARGRLAESWRGLGRERDRLEEILNTMEDGVLMTDAEGKIVQLNAAARRLFGLQPEPLGRPIVELVRTPELQTLLTTQLDEGGSASGEITVSRGGAERRVLARVSPILKDDERSGAVIVFHDVTERRRLEQVRRDFVANVSHELKTPLTAIRGYAETLAESPPGDPAQAKVFLDTILKHARRLGSLVDDLLELSRIESGQAVLNRQPVPLAHHLERVVQTFGPAASQRTIDLAFSVPDRMPPLLADPVALDTILSNLVENAVKYADSGGRVKITGSVQDGMARIDVADTGPGIPPAHLSRLFERFYRVDASRSRELGGTGLGLAIVKHLCQALGGWATVESEPGRGSTFSVYLPLAGSAGAPPEG